MNNMVSVFTTLKLHGITIVELLNKDQKVVAALYLNKLDLNNITICECKSIDEKYYLYLNGVAIFFTYFKKLEK